MWLGLKRRSCIRRVGGRGLGEGRQVGWLLVWIGLRCFFWGGREGRGRLYALGVVFFFWFF